MMAWKNPKISTILLFLVVAGLAFYSLQTKVPGQKLGVSRETSVAPQEKEKVKLSPPSGKQTYDVAQAAGIWPKFTQATIDPPDVHVGDTQNLSVVIEDEEKISSVRAEIQTDNGVHTVVLSPGSSASAVAPRYYLDSKNILALAPQTAPSPFKIASAETQTRQQTFTYSGSWVVKDTHSAKYYTTFIAEDVLGRSSKITVAWLDPCATSGSYGAGTMSSNCSVGVSGVDGADNGSVTIPSGVTLTLNSGAIYVWNPGQSITVNGTILIGSGVQLTKGYPYWTDVDNDSFPLNRVTLLYDKTLTSKPGYVRRSASSSANIDCDDASASIVFGSTMVKYQSSVACGSCSSEIQTCQSSGAWSGTYAYSACSSVGSATAWYRDSDGDSYGNPNVTTLSCGQPAGYVSNHSDCDDTTASITPNSTRVRYQSLVTCAGGGTSCASETQTCQVSGIWSGSFTETTDCSALVSARSMYAASAVCSPTTCSSETQTCLPSGWSGTYAYATCSSQDSPTTWYRDADGDGFGNPDITTSACGQPAGYVANNTDCNDNPATGGASVWKNWTGLYIDKDGDGYGSGSAQTVCGTNTQPAGYVLNNTDCNDSDLPGGLSSYVFQNTGNVVNDDDQDGWAFGPGAAQCTGGSTALAGRTYYRASGGAYTWLDAGSAISLSGDCEPINGNHWHNVNGWYDRDNDSYTDNATGAQPLCSGSTLDLYNKLSFPYRSSPSSESDCNDNSDTVQVNRYLDNDGDTYGVGLLACVAAGAPGYVNNSTDCYDLNANVKPDAGGYYILPRGTVADSAGNTGNSFDYNCDGLQEPYWRPQSGTCVGASDAECISRGLSGPANQCQYVVGYKKDLSCGPPTFGPDPSNYDFLWQSVPACGTSAVHYFTNPSPGSVACDDYPADCTVARTGVAFTYQRNCFGFNICNSANNTQLFCR